MVKVSQNLTDAQTAPRLRLPPLTVVHSHFLISLMSQYLHVFINEVTALVPVLRDCHYAFAVYTAQRTKQRWPLVLAAQTEKDMNDWVTAEANTKVKMSCRTLHVG